LSGFRRGAALRLLISGGCGGRRDDDRYGKLARVGHFVVLQAHLEAQELHPLGGRRDRDLVLVDLRDSPLDGKAAEDLLHEIGITVNRNAVPNDPRPPMVTSGLRVGTPALATRGFGDAEFTEAADIIATALAAGTAADLPALRQRVTRLARDFQLYEGLEDWTLVDR